MQVVKIETNEDGAAFLADQPGIPALVIGTAVIVHQHHAGIAAYLARGHIVPATLEDINQFKELLNHERVIPN